MPAQPRASPNMAQPTPPLTLREQIRAAMQLMTDDASYHAKYRRARLQLDPEFRERSHKHQKKYVDNRYVQDSDYRQRRQEAARQRSQTVIADPEKRAALNAKRRERYHSDPEYRAKCIDQIKRSRARKLAVSSSTN